MEEKNKDACRQKKQDYWLEKKNSNLYEREEQAKAKKVKR